MRIIVALLLLTFHFDLYPQTASESVKFLIDILGKNTDAIPQEISESDQKYILGALSKKEIKLHRTFISKINSSQNNKGIDVIALTNEEIDSLRKEFNSKEGYLWNNNTGKTYTYANPVFLRENSICFFYYWYYCGDLCGEGIFAIYKKIDGKWQYYMTIWEWIS